MSEPSGQKSAPAAFDTSHLDSGIGQRTANTAAVTMVSSAIIFAIQILQLAILSRLLTPEDFGLVGMAMAATMFIRLFSDVGLPTATVQRSEIDQAFVTAVFYIDLLFSLALMLVCLAIAPLAASLFSEPRVTDLILVIAITFPMSALRGQHQALLTRRMMFVQLNAMNVLSNLIGAVVAILCAWQWQLGYWSIVAGLLAMAASSMVICWVVSPWVPSRPGSLAAGKSAIGFGLNLLVANLSGWLWKQADRAFIGWRWDASELGYYTRAYSVLMVPLNLISGPLGSAVIPALSRLQHKADEWTALMQTAARAMGFFAGLLTLGLALNAEFIVAILLGPDWSYSASIFALLALSLFPSFIWEHSRFVFISLGRTDTMRNYAMGAAITHVIAFAIGVSWGAIGVAISLAIASVIVTPFLLVMAARVAGCTFGSLALQFLPSLAAMLLTGVIAYLVQGAFSGDGSFVEALVKSLAIALVYSAFHLLLLPFSQAWRSDLSRLWDFAGKTLTRRNSA